LFPKTSDETRRFIALNFTANALGLGNAATPLGLSAMRSMSNAIDGSDEYASDAMIMFLVINASSLQLFPTTVVTLRAAAGSAAPASILAATLVSTGISTVVAIVSCIMLRTVCKLKVKS
jgi:spore maturation protein A